MNAADARKLSMKIKFSVRKCDTWFECCGRWQQWLPLDIFTFTVLECFARRGVSPWTDLNVIVTHSHAAEIIRRATRIRRQFPFFHSIRRVIRSRKLSVWSRWWLEIMFFAVNLFKFLSRGGCSGTQLYCLCLCVHFPFHCCRDYLFPLSLPFIVIVSDI